MKYLLSNITTINVYQDIHANKVNAFQTFLTLNNVVATKTVDMENIARTVNASHKSNAPAIKTAHPENTAKMANADTGELLEKQLLSNDFHFTLLF